MGFSRGLFQVYSLVEVSEFSAKCRVEIEIGIIGERVVGFCACNGNEFQVSDVAKRVVANAALAYSEEFTRTAQFQVFLGDVEAARMSGKCP